MTRRAIIRIVAVLVLLAVCYWIYIMWVAQGIGETMDPAVAAPTGTIVPAGE